MSDVVHLGITPPLSLADPTDKEIEETERVKEVLNSLGIFEDDDGMMQRRQALEQLEIMAKDWIKEMAQRKNYPSHLVGQVGGKIFTFGSYRLGVNAKGADVDALLVAPRFVERSDFFQDFHEKLRDSEYCSDIHCVVDAFVPVMKIFFMSVDIDLLFAKLDMQIIPEDIDLRANTESLLRNLNERCVRSLNGCRVTDEILAQVPDAENFRVTLKVVRIWAKNHGIYSNALGFLGGVSWALLVARICQLYPKASPSNLIMRFFHVMCMWNWPKPVELCDVVPPQLPFAEWDPRTNISDQYHIMPIITPVFPRQNSTFNVGVSSKTVIMREMELAKEMVQSIMFGKKSWRDLLECNNFFENYKHFVVVIATSTEKQAHQDYQGLVESQLRKLVRSFEHNNCVIAVAQIYTKKYNKVREEESDHITKWIVGIEFQRNQVDGKLNVDLTYDITSFINVIKNMTNHNPAHELDVVYQRRRDLTQYLPKEEHCKLTTRPRRRRTDSVRVENTTDSSSAVAAAAAPAEHRNLNGCSAAASQPNLPPDNGATDTVVPANGTCDAGHKCDGDVQAEQQSQLLSNSFTCKRPHSPVTDNLELTPLKRVPLHNSSIVRNDSVSSNLSQASVASVLVTLDTSTDGNGISFSLECQESENNISLEKTSSLSQQDTSSPEMIDLSLEPPSTARSTLQSVRPPIQKNIKLRLTKKSSGTCTSSSSSNILQS